MVLKVAIQAHSRFTMEISRRRNKFLDLIMILENLTLAKSKMFEYRRL